MKTLLNRFIVILIFILLTASGLYSQTTPYTILISFDGFRWDYTNRGLTPNFDYIEKHGVKALSLKPSFPSITFPNHISIVTGMYPQNHGVIANTMYDPVTDKLYSLRDTAEVRNAYWYKGEMIWETARRQGVITASYFWPGSEMNLEYRRPTYYEKYEHERDYVERINGVINWLKLPYNQQPKFITLYYDLTDSEGHRYGPNSPEVNAAIARLDSLIGFLFKKLDEIKLRDSVNLIIVSDHGMTEISKDRYVNIEEIANCNSCKFFNRGAVMNIFINDKNEVDAVFNKLKRQENHYKVYKPENVPAHFHFNNNHLIGDLFVLSEPGWSVGTTKDKDRMNDYNGGNHGFDNSYIDMHGIFYAIGPSFKENYKTGTIENINIYPLLCKILNIIPKQNIDGKLENISFILKEKE
ncbi:MAG: alkaline phosphatase family protein [Ignavibacterium sp.]|jgi:predicted AlkP superfamily pyrophosphatase or phosphodiesterase|uniref:alkaline phosphatase family protein n=1 Tax=Ignavibacterium sp. TaxID=2651167 RepID=UPI0032970AB7